MGIFPAYMGSKKLVVSQLSHYYLPLFYWGLRSAPVTFSTLVYHKHLDVPSLPGEATFIPLT